MESTPKASAKPSVVSYEDFDVFSGKDGLSRDEYKKSTFHMSQDNGDNSAFNKAAELMEDSGSELEMEAKEMGNASDKAQQANTKKQATEAAL